MAKQDPEEIAKRPVWLRPFSLVRGIIVSAPLDSDKLLQKVVDGLRAKGWTPVVQSIGSNFGTIPLPKGQPLSMYLHRKDIPYTPDDAQRALTETIRAIGANYSPWSQWAGEISREVIEPTVQQATKTFGNIGFTVVAVVGAFAAFQLLQSLQSQRSR